MQTMPVPVGGYKLPSGRGMASDVPTRGDLADAKKPVGKKKAPLTRVKAKAGKK